MSYNLRVHVFCSDKWLLFASVFNKVPYLFHLQHLYCFGEVIYDHFAVGKPLKQYCSTPPQGYGGVLQEMLFISVCSNRVDMFCPLSHIFSANASGGVCVCECVCACACLCAHVCM